MGLVPCVAVLALLVGGCAVAPPGVDIHHEAQAQGSRVQFLVLHYTGENERASLDVLTQGPVSSHYLVGDGARPTVYRLVPEDRMALHAGASEWQGRRFLNASSIGIEIVNAGWRDGPQGRTWSAYPAAQVEAVVALVKDVVWRHGIRPDRVLGHSDIAPGRKQDPGPLFPWRRLAQEGLVRWPEDGVVAAARGRFEAALPPVEWFQQRLAEVGYGVPRTGLLDEGTRQVLQAFQMKYRPARHDGEPDAETAALLLALAP